MNILKIKGNFLFFFFSLICLITGYFKDYLLFLSLILVHECGHFLCAKLLSWKVLRIELYPFGGVTILEESINRPMKEELLILLGGPLVQIMYYLLFRNLFSSSFASFHYALLFFNLLPIYPLDGGKLWNLCLESIFPFQFSHKLLIVSSVLFLGFSLFFFHHFFFLLSFLFLGIQIFLEKQKEPILFHKFLLERSLFSYSFPYFKKISGVHFSKMYRDTYHFFLEDGKWVSEKEALKTKFFR